MDKLGHLKKVEPRAAWPNEASDFTPWLAETEHFAVLAELLHLDSAEVEETEKSIGDFSADIVARDRDGFVLVENQLAQTDHNHLGQLLTYLAGLEGETKVVWIATKFREEHRAAIDWLNEETSEKFSFFALELEVVRIGDSALAPLFHVVAKPNSWSRHVSRRTKQISNTANNERQARYQEYWTEFATYLDEAFPGLRGSNPPKDHWWDFPTGRTDFAISLTAGARDHNVTTEFVCRKDPDNRVIAYLRSKCDEQKISLPNDLIWDDTENRKASKLVLRKQIDPFERTNHQAIFSWYATNMNMFKNYLVPLVRNLEIAELPFPDHDDRQV